MSGPTEECPECGAYMGGDWKCHNPACPASLKEELLDVAETQSAYWHLDNPKQKSISFSFFKGAFWMLEKVWPVLIAAQRGDAEAAKEAVDGLFRRRGG